MRPSLVRLIGQSLGFLVGIGLLIWCLTIAFSPENREQFDKLKNADWRLVAALSGLSLVIMVISGEVFRLSLRPVQKLGVLSTHSTNAIANALALLPFKIGMIFRILMHNRRDGVPLLTIGAWFAAISAVMVGVIVPIAGAALWLHRLDGPAIALALGGVVLCCGGLVMIAKAVGTEQGWALILRLWRLAPLPASLRAGSVRGDMLLARAREGVRILSSGRTIFACAALRVLDVLCQALRFAIAARILGIDIPKDQATVAGIVYFLVGALAPFGQLGVRERLTSMLPSEMPMATFQLVVLIVTAADILVLLVCALIGAAYLRARRSPLRRETAAASTPEATPA